MSKIYLFILFLILFCCSKNDIAGGTIEIPNGYTEGKLIDQNGQSLIHFQISITPNESTDPLYISQNTFTDNHGKFNYIADSSTNYQVLIIDSNKYIGSKYSSDSTPTFITLDKLNKITIQLNPKAKSGWIGIQGTNIWKRTNNQSNVYFDYIPKGNYNILYIDDSTKVSRTIFKQINIHSDTTLTDSIQVLIYAKDSSSYDLISSSLSTLGLYSRLAILETGDYISETQMAIFAPDATVSKQDLINLEYYPMPILCMNPKYYYALHMAQDSNSYLDHFDNTNIALNDNQTFITFDENSNQLAWNTLLNPNQILYYTSMGHAFTFKFTKGIDLGLDGKNILSDRYGFGLKNMQMSPELLKVFQKIIIQALNNQKLDVN